MRSLRRLALLCLLLSWLSLPPAHAAIHPTLRIWSVNNLGRADLLPGDSLQVVIELREAQAARATMQHLTPPGLVLESVKASSGDVVSDPFVSWAGAVTIDQPVNIVLTYRVAADAVPGDRDLRAQAQVNGAGLHASTVVRVCCIPAPPAQQLIYLPLIRR